MRKKLKNKKLILIGILILVGIIILSANAGFCADAVAQHTPALPAGTPVKNDVLHNAIIKFTITMAGVLLSSVLIWAGLSIYNKFFVKTTTRNVSPDDDILRTPKTIEDAVAFFIKKNKLN